MYKNCTGPFNYVEDFSKCVKSSQFYIIVIGSVLICIIFMIIGLITYFKRKKILKNGIESTKLIFSKKDPVYKGY